MIYYFLMKRYGKDDWCPYGDWGNLTNPSIWCTSTEGALMLARRADKLSREDRADVEVWAINEEKLK